MAAGKAISTNVIQTNQHKGAALNWIVASG
jgi:hypothetical protein